MLIKRKPLKVKIDTALAAVTQKKGWTRGAYSAPPSLDTQVGRLIDWLHSKSFHEFYTGAFSELQPVGRTRPFTKEGEKRQETLAYLRKNLAYITGKLDGKA